MMMLSDSGDNGDEDNNKDSKEPDYDEDESSDKTGEITVNQVF
jgi:hypothetical protein